MMYIYQKIFFFKTLNISRTIFITMYGLNHASITLIYSGKSGIWQVYDKSNRGLNFQVFTITDVNVNSKEQDRDETKIFASMSILIL